MSNLNQILLRPTDVLLFRDGRPMSGSLAGHTAAWPLPDVTNHALHAALHRAGLSGVHEHRRGRSGAYGDERDRKFGSLVTSGPFPVNNSSKWFFPRPKDAQGHSSVKVTLRPVRSLAKDDDPWIHSSLPEALEYAVARTEPPSKESGGEPWISQEAFAAYLKNETNFPDKKAEVHFLNDGQIADREHQIGIGIDPDTQSQDKKNFYSAHYLRLREGFQLGLLAEAMDKGLKEHGGDLIKALINGHPEKIVVGGQQRICSASRSDITSTLPLPKGLQGKTEFMELPHGKFALKWVLLAPAIWPEIPSQKKDGSPQNAHPGGWLPNWVFLDWDNNESAARLNERNGEVLLTAGPGLRKAARKGGSMGSTISARLVAAIVPKPISVTGWALRNETDRLEDGAKSTHLAVPAGAVYYFEANSPADAASLANALNWHGSTNGTEIKNRRSTLLGEKGYGLGVCGTWQFYEDVLGRPKQ